MNKRRQNVKKIFPDIVKTAKPHPPGEEHLPTPLFPPLVLHPLLLSGRLLFQPLFLWHTPSLHPQPSSLPYIKAVLFFRDQQVKGIKGASGHGMGGGGRVGVDGERGRERTTEEQVEERTVSVLHTSGETQTCARPPSSSPPPPKPPTHPPRRPYVPTQQSLTLTLCDPLRSIVHPCTRFSATTACRV